MKSISLQKQSAAKDKVVRNDRTSESSSNEKVRMLMMCVVRKRVERVTGNKIIST